MDDDDNQIENSFPTVHLYFSTSRLDHNVVGGGASLSELKCDFLRFPFGE